MEKEMCDVLTSYTWTRKRLNTYTYIYHSYTGCIRIKFNALKNERFPYVRLELDFRFRERARAEILIAPCLFLIYNIIHRVDDRCVHETTGTCALVVWLFIFNLFRTNPPTIRPLRSNNRPGDFCASGYITAYP